MSLRPRQIPGARPHLRPQLLRLPRLPAGPLKAPFVVVRKATFTVTAGEPARFRSKSKVKCDAHGVWCFCPKCGTQVFWLGDKGNKLDIFAGTLDDTKLFQPKK